MLHRKVDFIEDTVCIVNATNFKDLIDTQVDTGYQKPGNIFLDGDHTILMEVSPARATLLSREEVRTYTEEKCYEESVFPQYLIKDGILKVYGDTIEKSRIYLQQIQSGVLEQRIKLNKKEVEATKSSKWKNSVKDWRSKYPWQSLISVENDTISVCATKDIIEEAITFVLTFLDRTITYHETFLIPDQEVRLIKTFHRDELANIAHINGVHDVRIDILSREESGLLISGTRRGLQQVKLDIQKLLARIILTTTVVSMPGVNNFLRTGNGRGVIPKVEEQCKVIIQVEEELDDTDLSSCKLKHLINIFEYFTEDNYNNMLIILQFKKERFQTLVSLILTAKDCDCK